ncbi:MAG: hypothetical protein H6919_04760 [Sphingomonadaceae bacterium]|nr:hypothetical protein [Sphingomonadaceae bacterium]
MAKACGCEAEQGGWQVDFALDQRQAAGDGPAAGRMCRLPRRERAAEAATLRDGLDLIAEREKAKHKPHRLTVKEAIEGCFEARSRAER